MPTRGGRVLTSDKRSSMNVRVDTALTPEARVRLTKRSYRHAALAIAAAGLAAGPLYVPTLANASPVAPITAATADAAAGLSAMLVARSAGTYINASGRMVITVTDAKAAAAVRAAGAVPMLVKHSAAELASATATLTRTAEIP